MKKRLLIIPLVLLLLFSGCSPKITKEKKADVSSFFEDISASFSARFGEIEAGGKLTYTPENLTLEFTFPKTVKGFVISVDSQGIALSYKNLTVKKQNSSLTESFNAFAVFSALNSARNTGILKKLDGKTLVTGDGFEITLDGENRISEIEIPEKRIYIKMEG